MSFKIFLVLVICFASYCESIGPIPCNEPNEEYHCGGACQTECATLGKPCPIINIRCNDACYCIDGYARDSTGKCIPQQDCFKQ